MGGGEGARGECPVSTVGDRAGWRFRRGRGKTTPLGSVGDAGVVATAVAAAMDNERREVISPSERGNRGKERSRWWREGGEMEDERDLNGKRGRW